MFRDLKEYQEIQNLYANNVYLSEEEKQFIEVIKEAELTDEELQYLSENTEEIINDLKESELLDEKVGALFKLGGLVKGLSGAKNASKLGNLGKMSGASKPLFKKGIISKLTQPLQRFKPGPMGKKILKTAAAGLGVAGITGAANLARLGLKARSDAKQKAIEDAAKKKAREDAIDKQVDKYVADRKAPINKDLTIDKSAEGKKKYDEKKAQREAENKKTEVQQKPQTEVDKIAATPRSEIKKTGRTAMIKKNIDRFGKDRVQMLQDKNKDFQAMKKGNMSKDDFIKKYPKSITAQREKGLRDQTEWDAYDLVLEYLHSTGQVTTIEEANYVMTEMDAKTIQGIVEEQKKNLNEVKGLTKLVMKTPLVKLVPATIGTGIVTKMIASKMGQKSGENEIKKSTTPVPMGDGDAKKSDPIKDLIPNIKKRNKALEDAIEKS